MASKPCAAAQELLVESDPMARRLATDPRMTEVWDWYSEIIAKGDELEDLIPSGCKRFWGISLFANARRAAQMPAKPGNLPAKEREKYFEQVRRHANALLGLLAETRYDCLDGGRPLDGVDVDERFTRWRQAAEISAFAFKSEYLVAYRADADGGITELPFDYPHCHLTEILADVIEWSHEENFWGRGGAHPSMPIRMSGDGARAHYFNLRMYEMFLRYPGVKMPFQVLATLANVVLELPPDRHMDADTARKQVTRYLSRTKT